MIRPARQADTTGILDLTAATGVFKPHEVETLEEVLCDFFDHNHHFAHRAFVREEAGRVVGHVYHALEEMTARTWCLWWIAVSPDQQGKGIGRELLAFVEDDVRAVGGRLLVIETSDTPAYELTRRFYLKHGYAAAAAVPDYYADGDGKVVFWKRLRGGDNPPHGA
ncbi:MAG: GNAT family N-acetyltransferase [Gemmataceae bacterium]|nr:GNAT family N-acetyltransferase [Gemmataceae bacterium]